MTVRELAALGRYPWHGALGRFGEDDRRQVEEALGADRHGRLRRPAGRELSGGERQRAWIAMLVAQDTGVMLLDEPISALDIAHQVEMLGLVRELSRKRGLCVVVVLHDPNMAARYCDELIALKNGKLLTRGTPQRDDHRRCAEERLRRRHGRVYPSGEGPPDRLRAVRQLPAMKLARSGAELSRRAMFGMLAFPIAGLSPAWLRRRQSASFPWTMR